MSRVVILAGLAMIAAVGVTLIVYLILREGEKTRRQGRKLDHEREMQRDEHMHDTLSAIEDDPIDRELGREDEREHEPERDRGGPGGGR